MLHTVQNERFFFSPGGLFRQDSDRLGHGQNFFRAPEGVPKYTKKAKCVRGVVVKSHVHRGPPPLFPMGPKTAPYRHIIRVFKILCTWGTPLPYVHRAPPPLCAWHMYIPPRNRFGVFRLFSVLWYTFRGSKKVFAMALTV